MTAVFINLFISSPAPHLSFSPISYSLSGCLTLFLSSSSSISISMCFSLSADVTLLSLLLLLPYMLSPSLHLSVSHSHPVRSAELYGNSQKGKTMPQNAPCVSNNLPFLVILSFPSFHAPFSFCLGSLYSMLPFRNHCFSAIFLKPTPFLCHSSLSMLFPLPSPPLLSLHLLLLLPLFPASHFPKVVALYTHSPLPIKSSHPLNISSSQHPQKGGRDLNYATNYRPCPPPPNCAMHIKLDQRGTFQRAHDEGEQSKETITAEGGEAEVDCEDKGYVTVVKTPRCPSFEILHPTICSSSDEFVIYLLLASQGLWSSVCRV